LSAFVGIGHCATTRCRRKAPEPGKAPIEIVRFICIHMMFYDLVCSDRTKANLSAVFSNGRHGLFPRTRATELSVVSSLAHLSKLLLLSSFVRRENFKKVSDYDFYYSVMNTSAQLINQTTLDLIVTIYGKFCIGCGCLQRIIYIQVWLQWLVCAILPEAVISTKTSVLLLPSPLPMKSATSKTAVACIRF